MPELVGLFGGRRAGELAGKVAEAVQQVAGTADPAAAARQVQEDAAKAAALRLRLEEIRVQYQALQVQDAASERQSLLETLRTEAADRARAGSAMSAALLAPGVSASIVAATPAAVSALVLAGFFGFTAWSYDDRNKARPNDPFYPDMPNNLDYISLAQEQWAAHRNEVDLLIPITHVGDVIDSSLALSVGGFDAILGGHSHTLLQSINPASTNGVPIIQGDAYATYVGRLDLTYDLKQKKVVDTAYVVTPVTAEALGVTPDPAVEKLVEDTLQTYAPGSQDTVAEVKTARNDHHTVAELAARAAMAQIHADAAVIDEDTVWDSLPAGPVTPQHFYNSFKVERQPPGTPGFNAFYTASISGASLRALATASRTGWVTVAPDAIDDGRTYLLVGQKRTLNHPEDYLPAGVTLASTPVVAMEAWEALNDYAKARAALCQYMDEDEAVPQCTR